MRWFFLALTLLATQTTAQAGIDVATFADTGLISGVGQSNNNSGGFTSGGQFFNNTYHTDYNYATGFAVSSMTDTTTPGASNQYSAITGKGNGDADYGVLTPTAFVNLTGTVQSIDLTNTTYAYLSMKNGDQFAKKFSTGDFFDVVITGYTGLNGSGSTTGAVKSFLANYSGPLDNPLSTWMTVNLTALGGAQSIGFTFESSDTSTYFGVTYINTPAYVAVDNLVTLTSVPEPSSLVLCLTSIGIVAVVRRRRLARITGF